MKFTKMHGLGNDYVYVNCFAETVEDPCTLAKAVSDRHFGIGADGLILIKPSDSADCEMAMYNADGSRGEMCGNGIRCVGKYMYDYGLTEKTALTVETLAGMKYLDLTVENGKVSQVRVDMGSPILLAEDIPVDVTRIDAGEPETDEKTEETEATEEIEKTGSVVDRPITVNGKEYRMTCVSMGNPHAVVYVDDVEHFPLEEVGPLFEHHPCFPNRINTEFVRVIDRCTVQMRVWERGSGETMACGTGSCAVAVASVLNGLTENSVTVKLLGGDLQVEWDEKANTIYMTGPAVAVFDGIWGEQ